jgi:hypothetical protein
MGTSTVHRTLTDHGIMQPIDKVVYALADLCNDKGITMSIANSSSALYPKLPLFDFNKG